MQIKIMI